MYPLTASSNISSGIVLGTIGAILTYAVTATVAGVDIAAVGVILMAAGAVLTFFGLVGAILGRSGRSTTGRVHDDRATSTYT